MQLENIATPTRESPQLRYASLHRAIERGLDSEELWKELAEVSLQLGHDDEAVRCLRRMPDGTQRRLLESKLTRLGLIQAPDAATRGAPAASHAGARRGPIGRPRTAEREEASPEELRLEDHVMDAAQFLFLQRMPIIALLTTLAFPLVVGVGGFLTAGGSPLLLTAIAALPGLSVLAIVGAMARRILLTSTEGSIDVPRVPEFGDLLVEARRFLVDGLLVFGALLAPSLIAFAVGVPAATALPCLVVGAFFTPMAWGLRQLRGDFVALSPVVLFRSIARCRNYAGIALAFWVMFSPAVLVAWGVFGRPVWIQIAAIGPLAVLPLFASSRMLGTWFEARRRELGGILRSPNAKAKPAAASAPAPAPVAAAPVAESPRQPRRPENLGRIDAVTTTSLRLGSGLRRTRNAPAPKQPPAAAPAPAPAAAPARAKAPAPRPRAEAPKHAAKAAQPTARAKPPAKSIEGRSPQRGPLTDAPDLSHMPGAVVVSGTDRARSGAAARR